MRLLGRYRAAAPLTMIAAVVMVDVQTGPTQTVLALTVIAPLLAATYLGCRTTAFYGLLALATAVLLGWYDQLYTEPMWLAQLVRLVGVAFGGVVAVVGCRARVRREEQIRRLVGEAAAAQLREIDTARQAALAEGIQRGLLPDPPLVRRLDIAVRYVPAADDLQVGGDWYDVFPLADGRTAMVIGDVAGHDGNAAALMAQLRNLLRGIAQVLDDAAPAALVTALDLAVRRLRVSTLASMILAEITPQASLGSSTGAEPEAWRLRWSNAGHPPPLLVCADRRIRLLETTPELLLGVDPTRPRTTHELTLQVGDAVVLFTDGLVERRGELIDDGLWRVQAAADAAGRSVDELCEALLSLVPDHPDDDVALLGFQGQPTTVAASEHDPSRLRAASG